MPSQTPLRLGIVGPCPPPHGGVTRVIQNHLKFWEAGAVETTVIPFVVPDKPEIYPGATLIDYRGRSSRVAAAWRVARWIPYLGAMRPEQYLNLAHFEASLERIARERKLDVLWGHHATITGAVTVRVGRKLGIPVALQAYGETHLATPQDARRKGLIEFAVRGAEWVITTSEHCRNGAIMRGAMRERTAVIYASIDLETFRPGLDGDAFRAKHNVPADAVVVSVLGLAVKRKLDTLLDALKPLFAESRVHVLIGGTGEDRDYLAARLKESGGGRVQALGFVPEPDLPAFYAATDIMVVSQRTMVECMGQSMKEAMACGRPVVGSNIGGVPEAIDDGHSGLLFNADDPLDLVRAIRELASDPERRKTMGVRGRQITDSKFDARIAARQAYDLLRAVAGRAAPRDSATR